MKVVNPSGSDRDKVPVYPADDGSPRSFENDRSNERVRGSKSRATRINEFSEGKMRGWKKKVSDTKEKTSRLSSTEKFGRLAVAMLAGHGSTQDTTPWRAVQGLPWWSHGEGIRPLSPSPDEDNAACLPACLSTDVATNCRDIRSSGNKANVHARTEVYERPGFRVARLRGDNLLDTSSLSSRLKFPSAFPHSRNHFSVSRRQTPHQ